MVEMKEGLKPKNFRRHPYGSTSRHSETETIARNVMVILSRTGNEFRNLSWEEYKEERLKDGNFTESEGPLFDKVRVVGTSAEAAYLFCPTWLD